MASGANCPRGEGKARCSTPAGSRVCVSARVMTMRWMPSSASSLAVAGRPAYLLADGIKQALQEPRPADVLSDVVLRGSAQEGYGYVSGQPTFN